ncbi:hypothetical protein L747_11090 [Levilactobacillus brevis BSO 464]|nr:hypothetical protein L747_11090 [Levilactobacillus brevis BSO 464]
MKLVDKKHITISVRRTTRWEFWLSLLGFAVIGLLLWWLR